MANIILTLRCNNDCPYCFARAKLKESSGPPDMTLDELKTVIDFVKRDFKRPSPEIPGAPTVRLLGGEPTLHPGFKDALDLLLDAGLRVMLLSNGRFGEETCRFIEERLDRLICSINVNKPDSYDARGRQDTDRTLNRLVAENRGIISINVFETDFDFKPFLKTVRRIRPKFVRLDIARPIVGLDNRHIPFEAARNIENNVQAANHSRSSRRRPAPVTARKQSGLAVRIVQFVRDLRALKIPANFDCPLWLCFFDDEQRKELSAMGVRQHEVAHHLCHGVTDIGPGLKVWRCYPVAGVEDVRLTDFRSLAEVVAHFDRVFAYFKDQAPPDDRCRDCDEWHLCLGGCLAHKIRQQNVHGIPALTEGKSEQYGRWQALARSGRAAEALEAYRETADIHDPLVIGTLEFTIGDFEKAAGSLGCVPDHHPHKPFARLQQGQALIRLGRHQEALQPLESALQAFTTRKAPPKILEQCRVELDRCRKPAT